MSKSVHFAQLHHALRVSPSTAWEMHGDVRCSCCYASLLSLPYGMQVMLAVLARGYDWDVDLNEPVKTIPLPTLQWGLPMTFNKLQTPVTAAEE